MPKSIFVTRQIPELAIKMLRDKGYTVDVNTRSSIPTQKNIINFLKKKPYDAVLTLLTDKIDTRVFERAPSVKLYANYAIGFDNIDITEAKKRGITVTNAPGDITSEAVAEHTMAMILALAARIVEADEFVRRGKYKGWSPIDFIGTDIVGKTIGLIGAGRIGKKVAEYSKGLGMKVIYTDIKRNEQMEEGGGIEYRASAEEVLKEADIVSIHVPLLDSTHHLMNEARLQLMKPTAFLINTSRGPIVHEEALVKALQEKVISGAALDVFEFEPRISTRLRKMQNVILTPHIASASIAARNQMAEIAAQNIIDFLEGKTPKNIVNA